FPHVTTEFGHGESGTEVKVERNEKPKEKENGGVGSRRQGTRNRPPTAKALEAIANGLLTKDSKKKGKEDNVTRPRKRTYSRAHKVFRTYLPASPWDVFRYPSGYLRRQ
nr:homeodomain-like protein [Tanacetum cinerariifolium]